MPSIATSVARALPRYLLAGALAGVVIGGVEAISLNLTDPALNDRAILWWAPLFYALLFAPLGAVVGAVLHLLLARKLGERAPALAYASACAVVLFLGVLTAVRWRFHTDFSATAKDWGRLFDVAILGTAIVLAVAGFFTARRLNLRTLAFAATAFVALCTAASFVPLNHSRTLPATNAQAATGPNVILVTIDTLRSDYLTAYNADSPAQTPAIDAFAQDAVLFRNGVAQSPWTKPSFASIYASQQPREHAAIDRARQLPDEAETLAEALRGGGYTTIGMSNGNPNNSIAMNFDQGYDYFEDLRPDGYLFGMPVSAKRLSLYDRAFAKAINHVMPYTVNVEQYYLRADRITATALDWIDTKTKQGRPYFLTLHYMDPHDPYMNGARTGTGYPHHRFRHNTHTPKFAAKLADAYAGDIKYMDQHLAAFFDGLRARNLYDDALIVFISDHGEEFLEHGNLYHGTTLYEESIHVPLIVKLPNNAAAGTLNEHLASHIDIAPTILALADVDVPSTMRGQPLLDADGRPLNESTQHVISENDLLGPNLISVRTTNEKFIRDAAYGGEVTLRELYDLDADPGETTNLATQNTAKAEALAAILDAFLAQHTGKRPGGSGEIAPGIAEQLETLGYLE